MTSSELNRAIKQVSELVHKIYNETNEGPRLLDELFRGYPHPRRAGVVEEEHVDYLDSEAA
jgi:hypothetical protein